MKNYINLLGLLLLSLTTFGQIAIGTIRPEASALLDLDSTTRGLLPPRMTEVQMNGIVDPAEGLILYCLDCDPKTFYFYDGTEFVPLVAGYASGNAVETLDCSGAAHQGALEDGVVAIGVSTDVGYTGGTGVSYDGFAVVSTGVTGLIASVVAGTLNIGIGHLEFTISGTPSGDGIASFSVSFGGQVCSFDRTVDASGGGATVIVDVVSTTGRTWMDRNLGASQEATYSADPDSYGDLYQWGRNSDGHEKRVSPVVSGPVANGSEGSSFVTNGVSPYDWLTIQDATRWNGAVKGVHDPCPSGYRVPTDVELVAEYDDFPTDNAAGAFNSSLKLPVAGFRNSDTGSLESTGSLGFYWSSTGSGTYARYLAFDSSTANVYSYLRAYGFSVRCIKD